MAIALGNWAWQRDLANWGRSKFYQEIIIKPRKYGHTDSGESIYSWMNGRLCAAVPWRPTKSRTYKMLRLFILPPNEAQQQCMAGFYMIWSLEEKSPQVAFGCMHLSGKWRRNGFKENWEQTWHSCRDSHRPCGSRQINTAAGLKCRSGPMHVSPELGKNKLLLWLYLRVKCVSPFFCCWWSQNLRIWKKKFCFWGVTCVRATYDMQKMNRIGSQ